MHLVEDEKEEEDGRRRTGDPVNGPGTWTWRHVRTSHDTTEENGPVL